MIITELQEALTKEGIKWDMYIKEPFVDKKGKKHNPAIRAWFNNTPQIRTINKDNDCEIILKWFIEIKNNGGYMIDNFETWDCIRYRLTKR